MLTKTPSITESLIIDEVSELLNIITGIPPTNFPHKRAQSDKQILETLTKLTEKVDKLSEQVNKPKKVTSNHSEPTKGLEASKHVPQLLTKSYAQAANTAPVRPANSKARIKPTAPLSAFDKENLTEFPLDSLHYLYNYYMVCALLSHTYHVTYHVM